MTITNTLNTLERGCVDIISKEELKHKLSSGKKLIVKLGCDPTSPDLHLGHSVALSKMRAFQDLGHTGVLVIGDFTSSIGDPSGRDNTRPVLTAQQIKENAKTYSDQALKILDTDKTMIVFNSQWLSSFVGTPSGGISNLLNSLSRITVSRLMEREDFQKRIKSGNPISMLEMLYPIFQGYDSVALKADVELGGSDQLFNLLVGRDMQKIFSQTPQVIMTTPLLVGTDGVKKMSKSYGNYIGLTDTAKDIFGKIMSISDDIMWQYYEILTTEDISALKKTHPMEAKKNLAKIITERFHSSEIADNEHKAFEKVFSNKELPENVKEELLAKEMMLSDILIKVDFANSKRSARRLITQGAVKIDGKKIVQDSTIKLSKPAVLQSGKKNFCKIEIKK